MLDKKLTDGEIKEALECCYSIGKGCEDCPLCDIEECNDTLMAEYIKDLINRYESKIDDLTTQMNFLLRECERLDKRVQAARQDEHQKIVDKLTTILLKAMEVDDK